MKSPSENASSRSRKIDLGEGRLLKTDEQGRINVSGKLPDGRKFVFQDGVRFMKGDAVNEPTNQEILDHLEKDLIQHQMKVIHTDNGYVLRQANRTANLSLPPFHMEGETESFPPQREATPEPSSAVDHLRSSYGETANKLSEAVRSFPKFVTGIVWAGRNGLVGGVDEIGTFINKTAAGTAEISRNWILDPALASLNQGVDNTKFLSKAAASDIEDFYGQARNELIQGAKTLSSTTALLSGVTGMAAADQGHRMKDATFGAAKSVMEALNEGTVRNGKLLARHIMGRSSEALLAADETKDFLKKTASETGETVAFISDAIRMAAKDKVAELAGSTSDRVKATMSGITEGVQRYGKTGLRKGMDLSSQGLQATKDRIVDPLHAAAIQANTTVRFLANGAVSDLEDYYGDVKEIVSNTANRRMDVPAWKARAIMAREAARRQKNRASYPWHSKARFTRLPGSLADAAIEKFTGSKNPNIEERNSIIKDLELTKIIKDAYENGDNYPALKTALVRLLLNLETLDLDENEAARIIEEAVYQTQLEWKEEAEKALEKKKEEAKAKWEEKKQQMAAAKKAEPKEEAADKGSSPLLPMALSAAGITATGLLGAGIAAHRVARLAISTPRLALNLTNTVAGSLMEGLSDTATETSLKTMNAGKWLANKVLNPATEQSRWYAKAARFSTRALIGLPVAAVASPFALLYGASKSLLENGVGAHLSQTEKRIGSKSKKRLKVDWADDRGVSGLADNVWGRWFRPAMNFGATSILFSAYNAKRQKELQTESGSNVIPVNFGEKLETWATKAWTYMKSLGALDTKRALEVAGKINWPETKAAVLKDHPHWAKDWRYAPLMIAAILWRQETDVFKDNIDAFVDLFDLDEKFPPLAWLSNLALLARRATDDPKKDKKKDAA